MALLALVAGTALSPAAGESAGPRLSAQERPFTVTRAMSMNDPLHHRGQSARQIRTYIKHAPRGSTIATA